MAEDQQGAGSVYRLRLVARRDIAALDHPASRQQIARLGVGSSRKRANPQVRRWMHARVSDAGRGAIRILSLCSIICSALLYAASQVYAADDDWTVVTIARHGSWGVATASSQSQAIATAIRDCKAMAETPSDCGAMFTTIRGGWTFAKLCGDEKIIETGKTLQEAEQAAFYREMDLSLFYVPALPP